MFELKCSAGQRDFCRIFARLPLPDCSPSHTMDTSSESESYGRTRGHRLRGREAHRRPVRDRPRAGGSGGDDRSADISEKIQTLANTLQDTSRNLTKVDRMLGQYREHTDEQAEAMTLLRENLEESISQLQTQRRIRSNGVRSASTSASTLHSSDLEACSGSEGQRFYPTSPLRDYPGTPGRRRRSQSAGVRFKDASLTGEDIHTLHQSLRDLHCDQQRLSDDLDREIFRRNRSEIDTRRAMESLTEHMTTSQRQDSVSTRVERRLQELEREMHTEHRIVEREKRPEQRVTMSDDVQEVTVLPSSSAAIPPSHTALLTLSLFFSHIQRQHLKTLYEGTYNYY